jgi:hypothetical protein
LQAPYLEKICHQQYVFCIVPVDADGVGVDGPHNCVEDGLAAIDAHLQDFKGTWDLGWDLGDNGVATVLEVLLGFDPAETAATICKDLSLFVMVW